MPSRDAILAGLMALNAKPKQVLPPTGSNDRNHEGLVGQAGAVLRIRDRQNAEAEKPVEAKPETIYENEVRHFGVYWANIYRDQREADTKEKRIKAEAAKVKAAHAAENQRRIEAQAEREKRAKELQEANSRIILDNITKSEIRGILADATAPEIEAVLQKVRGWKMEKQSFAYSAALKEVREKKV